MNLCHARIEQGAGGMTVTFGNLSLDIDEASLAAYPKLAERAGSDVILGMRPECFFLAEEGAAAGDCVEGRVDLVEMLGAEALVYIQTEAQAASANDIGKARNGHSEPLSLVSRVSPRPLPKAGETVRLRYETDSLHFFDPKTGHALR